MSFLLDTNLCSAAIRDDRRLFARLQQDSGRRFTSRIVVAELYAWAYSKNDPAPILKRIDQLTDDGGVLEFDDDCAEQFGRLKGPLRRRGITIPPFDLLIASTALVHGFTLVTPNTRDFALIPGLSVVDWLAPEGHRPAPSVAGPAQAGDGTIDASGGAILSAGRPTCP